MMKRLWALVALIVLVGSPGVAGAAANLKVDADTLTIRGPSGTDTDLQLVRAGADSLQIRTSGTNRFSVGASIRTTVDMFTGDGTGVVVGHTAQVAMAVLGGAPEFQVLGTAATDAGMVIHRGTATAGQASYLIGSRSRNTTFGSFTIVNDGDSVFDIIGGIDDGVDYGNTVGRVRFVVDDSTPAENATGGAVTIQTTDVSGTEAERTRWNSSGAMIIGDGTTTSTADGTIVLVVDQRGNDDGAIILKSSDVSQPATGVREASTYGYLGKWAAAGGGMRLEGYTDADATTGQGSLSLIASSGDATVDQTHTSSTVGIMTFSSQKTDGGTSVTTPTGEDAIMTFRAASTTRLLLQAEGEMHITNTTLVALDEYDAQDGLGDASLLRALERERPAGVLLSEWDSYVKSNRADLVAAGILSDEEPGKALISVQKWNALQSGAIWQNTERILTVASVQGIRLAALETENAMLRAQFAALKSEVRRATNFRIASLSN